MRLTRAKRQARGRASSSTELGGIANVERAMRRAANQEITRLERALTFLATTASADAVHRPVRHRVGHHERVPRLSSATQSSSIQAVAPGIAEALIATAIGLVAAIPAVVAYNSLRAPDPRALRRDGQLRVRIPQHRRASLPEVSAGDAWRSSSERSNEALSQINVTPLVDVMLVLLVIFMVTAPILQQGVSVDLPKVQAGALTGEEEQLVVSVSADGQGLPERHADDAARAARPKLQAILRERPDRSVFLRADRGGPLRRGDAGHRRDPGGRGAAARHGDRAAAES